ncbi:hypothetical protein ACK1VC_25435 [Pseudomonas sp. XP2]|uniref:hypothetical protein n=1 Tax=Pseudomonas TaxID=286 RepID=UPI000AFA5D7E|nr:MULTISPECIES: hypothetical protein [Pseudomonas]MCE0969412.1 hypothetical protein [Pseudomonas sp. NMI4491_12]MCE1004643.1 hypothetical protein [Pseudomonas sp. NMI1173_11]WQE51479.1 hypothetical protein U0028_16445 [Pseudomonas putida]
MLTTADDGNEALRKQDWTLLLTDVQTPGLQASKKPPTRIIVMSGYYEFAGRLVPPGAEFLAKP